MATVYSSLGRPSNPVPQIPSDVYALIVNECATHDDLRPSLKNLSLTQKLLLPLCQRHLFKTVTYSETNFEKLTFFSESAPHLIDYIRNFHYTFSGNDVVVLKFIQNLKRVDGFYFAGDADLNNPPTDFLEDVDPQLAMAINNIVHSPDLRSLSLSRLDNYPMQYLVQLGNSPNLRDLSIEELGTDTVAAPIIDTRSYAPSAPLSSLSIGPRSGRTLSLLVAGFMSPAGAQPIFDFRSVQDLSVELDEPADVDGSGLLIQACTGLEELVCEVHRDAERLTFEGFGDFLLSGPSRTLRKVQFFAPINTYSGQYSQHVDFPRVKEQIKRLSDSHELVAFETLIISLDIKGVDSTVAEAERLYAELETWLKEMDVILSQDLGFPSLKEVSITVYITCTARQKFDKKQGGRLAKLYKPMGKKLRKKCFSHLSALGLEVEYEMELDLPDWDMMYMKL